jgi:hypothetical protein
MTTLNTTPSPEMIALDAFRTCDPTATARFLQENSTLNYRSLVEKVRVQPQFQNEEVLDYLLGERASMDVILKMIEYSPSLQNATTLTKFLGAYKVMYHLKKLMRLPFAQVQETIHEFLYVYPAPSAWGILLLLWEFEFARTPQVFEAFLDAKPDEYETQLCQELCPEFRAYLTA